MHVQRTARSTHPLREPDKHSAIGLDALYLCLQSSTITNSIAISEEGDTP